MTKIEAITNSGLAKPLIDFCLMILDEDETAVRAAPAAAGVTLTESGHRLQLNSEMLAESLPYMDTLLMHELCHIAYGHCMPRHREKHPVAWNVATDAWINATLPADAVAGLHAVPGPEVVGLERIPLPSAEYMYNHIINSAQAVTMGHDVISPHAGSARAEVAGSLDRLDLREAMRQAAEAGDERAKDHQHGFDLARCRVARPLSADVVVCPLLVSILKALRGCGKPRYRRGWRRTRVLSSIPGRDVHYAPRVLCAIDSSGSISDAMLAKAAGLATFLRGQGIHVQYAVFDTRVHYGPSPVMPSNVGERGGTDFRDIFACAGGYDAMVMMTDGEAEQVPLPHCPVVWAWVCNNPTRWPVRPHDAEVGVGWET